MMKKVTLLLLIPVLLNSHEKPMKLILHVDVNKTIIAEDAANSKNLDKVLIESLAKQYKGIWNSSLTQEITYVQYVKEYLFPGDKSDRALRRKRGAAVHSFLDVLKSMNDPRYPIILERFRNARKKVGLQKGRIFNSFYKLINYLEREGITYTIVLRTFGTDLGEISHELAAQANLVFDWEGYFVEGTLYLKSDQKKQEVVLETFEEIYAFFKSQNHIQIKDDFKYWNDHHEQAQYGKLFPINEANSSIKTLFFDDNATENIINPRNITSGCFMEPEQLIKSGDICSVDTLQAIENDDYFIKEVCERVGLN